MSPKTFWLSFCDGEQPPGQQFLGACLVDVTLEDAEAARVEMLRRFPQAQVDAEWIAAASRKAWALHCNPGGEMAFVDVTDQPELAYYERGVLMSRDEIAARDLVIRRDARRRLAAIKAKFLRREEP